MSCAREFLEQLYPSDEEILWSELRNYVEEGAIFVLGPGQNLDHIIYLINNNEIGQVEKLIEDEKIRRPSAGQIHDWEQSEDQLFKYLIIEPYIIIQEFSPPLH